MVEAALAEGADAGIVAAEGGLVCFEMVAQDERCDPMMALADMSARVVCGGRDPTAEEVRRLLARAGLACERIRAVDGAVHAITARPEPRPARA